MSEYRYPSLLSWGMLPHLLVTGLCVGAVAGVVNYNRADYAIHPSAALARALETTRSHTTAHLAKRAGISTID